MDVEQTGSTPGAGKHAAARSAHLPTATAGAALDGDGARVRFVLSPMLQVVSAVANRWQLHVSCHVGQHTRTQLTGLIFRKVLHVIPQMWPRADQTQTLMSTGAHKLLVAIPHAHLRWAAPPPVPVCGVSLAEVVGSSELLGVAVLVVLVRMSLQLTAIVQRSHARRMAVTYERVRCTYHAMWAGACAHR